MYSSSSDAPARTWWSDTHEEAAQRVDAEKKAALLQNTEVRGEDVGGEQFAGLVSKLRSIEEEKGVDVSQLRRIFEEESALKLCSQLSTDSDLKELVKGGVFRVAPLASSVGELQANSLLQHFCFFKLCLQVWSVQFGIRSVTAAADAGARGESWTVRVLMLVNYSASQQAEPVQRLQLLLTLLLALHVQTAKQFHDKLLLVAEGSEAIGKELYRRFHQLNLDIVDQSSKNEDPKAVTGLAPALNTLLGLLQWYRLPANTACALQKEDSEKAITALASLVLSLKVRDDSAAAQSQLGGVVCSLLLDDKGSGSSASKKKDDASSSSSRNVSDGQSVDPWKIQPLVDAVAYVLGEENFIRLSVDRFAKKTDSSTKDLTTCRKWFTNLAARCASEQQEVINQIVAADPAPKSPAGSPPSSPKVAPTPNSGTKNEPLKNSVGADDHAEDAATAERLLASNPFAFFSTLIQVLTTTRGNILQKDEENFLSIPWTASFFTTFQRKRKNLELADSLFFHRIGKVLEVVSSSIPSLSSMTATSNSETTSSDDNTSVVPGLKEFPRTNRILMEIFNSVLHSEIVAGNVGIVELLIYAFNISRRATRTRKQFHINFFTLFFAQPENSVVDLTLNYLVDENVAKGTGLVAVGFLLPILRFYGVDSLLPGVDSLAKGSPAHSTQFYTEMTSFVNPMCVSSSLDDFSMETKKCEETITAHAQFPTALAGLLRIMSAYWKRDETIVSRVPQSVASVAQVVLGGLAKLLPEATRKAAVEAAGGRKDLLPALSALFGTSPPSVECKWGAIIVDAFWAHDCQTIAPVNAKLLQAIKDSTTPRKELMKPVEHSLLEADKKTKAQREELEDFLKKFAESNRSPKGSESSSFSLALAAAIMQRSALGASEAAFCFEFLCLLLRVQFSATYQVVATLLVGLRRMIPFSPFLLAETQLTLYTGVYLYFVKPFLTYGENRNQKLIDERLRLMNGFYIDNKDRHKSKHLWWEQWTVDAAALVEDCVKLNPLLGVLAKKTLSSIVGTLERSKRVLNFADERVNKEIKNLTVASSSSAAAKDKKKEDEEATSSSGNVPQWMVEYKAIVVSPYSEQHGVLSSFECFADNREPRKKPVAEKLSGNKNNNSKGSRQVEDRDAGRKRDHREAKESDRPLRGDRRDEGRSGGMDDRRRDERREDRGRDERREDRRDDRGGRRDEPRDDRRGGGDDRRGGGYRREDDRAPPPRDDRRDDRSRRDDWKENRDQKEDRRGGGRDDDRRRDERRQPRSESPPNKRQRREDDAGRTSKRDDRNRGGEDGREEPRREDNRRDDRNKGDDRRGRRDEATPVERGKRSREDDAEGAHRRGGGNERARDDRRRDDDRGGRRSDRRR